MTHKLKLMLVLGLFSFLLTACGAQVHTETSFAKDGSGNRIIFIKIATKDESRIDGGFEKLDSVLKEHAPECIEVSRHEEPDEKVMVYELKYNFSDIEEFKVKTEVITGKESNIVWEQEQGAFAGSIRYSEAIATSELIQWAEDALAEENMSSAILSQLYEEEDSMIMLEGEKVWIGTKDAKFHADLSPVIKEISVYTVYDEKGEVRKQIKLSFSYTDYLSMDTEEGLAYLKKFSDKFRVDSTCNGYSVTLNGEEELKDFFSKASDTIHLTIEKTDLEIKDAVTNYYFENNSTPSIFSNKIEIKEVYNLNVLLSGFKVSAKTIQDYVSIPVRNSYTRQFVHHTYALQSTKSYNYIGEYDVNDTYYLYFSGGDSVDVKSAAVVFSINENLTGTQNVTLLISKNSIDFTSVQVMEYYSSLGEKVQYQDDDKTATITFTKELSYGKDGKENAITKRNTFSWHRLKYRLETDFSMEPYYDIGESNISCMIKLPSTFRVDSFSLGDKTFRKKEIKEYEDNVQWCYQADRKGDSKIRLSMGFSRANMIFYGIMCIAIMLVIGTALSIYFYVKGKKRMED